MLSVEQLVATYDRLHPKWRKYRADRKARVRHDKRRHVKEFAET